MAIKLKKKYETASQRMNRQLAAEVKKIDIVNILQPWPTIEQLEKDGIADELPWHDTRALFKELQGRGYFKSSEKLSFGKIPA